VVPGPRPWRQAAGQEKPGSGLAAADMSLDRALAEASLYAPPAPSQHGCELGAGLWKAVSQSQFYEPLQPEDDKIRLMVN